MPFTKGNSFWGPHNPVWNKGKCWTASLATASPSTSDVAWAAGIYEGEGSITLSSRRHSQRQVNLRVVQKDKWLIEQLHKFFGGTCKSYWVNAGSKKNPDERREYWYWNAYGPRAIGFVLTIYKFLSPRRQAQIRLVLDGARRVSI